MRTVLVLAVAVALAACTAPPTERRDHTDAAAEASPPALAAASPRAHPPADPTPTRSPAPTSTSTDEAPVQLPVDAGALVERFTIEVRDGTTQSAQDEITVAIGDTIELAVTTDAAGTRQAPDLGLNRGLQADRETIVPITVKRAGTFEILLGGALVAQVSAS